MKLSFLGTGNATATKCYNTCFLLEADGDFLLVDAGGGNTILSRLERRRSILTVRQGLSLYRQT